MLPANSAVTAPTVATTRRAVEEALKIEAVTEKERRTILAEAGREADIIRGKAEAEAIRIYGEAYKENRALGGFILVDKMSNSTVGMGLIEEISNNCP